MPGTGAAARALACRRPPAPSSWPRRPGPAGCCCTPTGPLRGPTPPRGSVATDRWRSVRVDASDGATRLRAMPAAVGNRRAGDPVMAFDEMAGVVLLLDGRSVGEAWYSRIDHGANAAGIRSVCTRPRPWGDTLPVVVYDRSPSTVDQDALRACGLSLTRDYRLVTVDDGGPLQVYVPTGAEEKDATMTEPPRGSDASRRLVSIVIPALNEYDNVPAVLERMVDLGKAHPDLRLRAGAGRRRFVRRHRRARHRRRARTVCPSRSCSSRAASARTRRSPPGCGVRRATARSCSVPTSRSHRS